VWPHVDSELSADRFHLTCQHTAASIHEEAEKAEKAKQGSPFNPLDIVRTVSKRLSFSKAPEKHEHRPLEERRATFELDDVERQQRIMTSHPHGLYESFRRGLLEYVS
jgi:hypothetical protein